MSFILDAIKKSEADRKKSQQADVYSLQDQEISQYPKHSRGSRWLLLCFALVILTLSGWYLWSPLLDFISDFSSPDNNASASVAAQSPVSKIESFEHSAEVSPTATDELLPSYGIDDPLPPNHQIKELWEQPVSFQNAIPNLDFAFHVFSEEAEQRTIIINDRRLAEGQMIARGLKLHTITESGVILYYQDRFFHVDVVTQW